VVSQTNKKTDAYLQLCKVNFRMPLRSCTLRSSTTGLHCALATELRPNPATAVSKFEAQKQNASQFCDTCGANYTASLLVFVENIGLSGTLRATQNMHALHAYKAVELTPQSNEGCKSCLTW
jgi:hypothetical protein